VDVVKVLQLHFIPLQSAVSITLFRCFLLLSLHRPSFNYLRHQQPEEEIMADKDKGGGGRGGSQGGDKQGGKQGGGGGSKGGGGRSGGGKG
jgi:uncharacterized membrane protein YgcG